MQEQTRENASSQCPAMHQRMCAAKDARCGFWNECVVARECLVGSGRSDTARVTLSVQEQHNREYHSE